jgi:small basic protein
MQFSLDTLAALATVLGTGISILALIQSRAWLVLISFLFVCISIAMWWYARQRRVVLNLASTVIEGHSIDSLNIANLRRRVNQTFIVQTAHHKVRIEGENMELTWTYTGFCRTDQVSTMEFSIDSDEGTTFEQLHCVAFDLGHDPEMAHPIRPILVGTEGISKKTNRLLSC